MLESHPVRRTLFLAAAIAGMAMVQGAVAACLPEDPPPVALKAFLDGAMADVMRTTGVPGAAISIVRDGRVVLADGYGFADLERRRPVDATRTLFRIGSVTKLFTYTALLQLVEQRRLSLGDDVNSRLSGMRIDDGFGAPVTIDALLAHRAGFEDGALGYPFYADPSRLIPLAEFLPQHPLRRVHRPGTVTSYSNYGAAVLGLVVEQAANMPYETYVQQNILDRLGMARTTLREPVDAALPAPHGRMDPALAADRAVGYRRVAGRSVPAPDYRLFPSAAPTGALASTATDMACFVRAQLATDAGATSLLLSAEAIRTMRTRAYADRPGGTDFSRGWFHTTIAGYEAFLHTGSVDGFKSNLVLVPSLNVGIFIAANAAEGWPLVGELPRLLLAGPLGNGTAAASPPTPPADFAARAAAYEGTYLTERRSYTRLEKFLMLGAGQAEVRHDGEGRLAITARGETRSWVEVAPLTFQDADGNGDTRVFVRDATGGIERFYQPLAQESFARLPLWQRAASVQNCVIAVAVLAISLLLRPLLRVRRTDTDVLATVRWARRAGFVAAAWALLFAVLLLQVRGALAAGSATFLRQWPPAPLQQLVLAGQVLVVAAAVSVLVALLVLVTRGGSWPERIQRVLFAGALLLLCAQMWVWNLFAPAAN